MPCPGDKTVNRKRKEKSTGKDETEQYNRTARDDARIVCLTGNWTINERRSRRPFP